MRIATLGDDTVCPEPEQLLPGSFTREAVRATYGESETKVNSLLGWETDAFTLGEGKRLEIVFEDDTPRVVTLRARIRRRPG